MKKLFALILLGGLASCGSDPAEKSPVGKQDSARMQLPPSAPVPARDSLVQQITALEKELYAAEKLDEQKAKHIVNLYEKYYQNYHRFSETPDYLFKAGEITENLNQPYRAIGFYTHCYEEYPSFKFQAECLFRMANLYDYKLNDYIKAKALYQEVIEKYPKSQLAKDAEAAIRLMGKSDQEMIREFEKKNKIN